MASKKLKSHEVNVGDKPNSMDVDRLSVLPELLLYHILSFLPTFYVVRMSVLSKHWRYMWTSVPVLHFNDDDITFQKIVKSKHHMFFKFVDNCLRHRKLYTQISDMSITRFKLVVLCDFESTSNSKRLDNWLRFAVQSNVKELDLSVGHRYCLPEFILSSRSLTILKLKRLSLEILYPISLPSLKSLSLISVYVEDKVKALQSLFSACPIIEDLHVGGAIYDSDDVCEKELPISGTLRNLSFDGVDLTAQWLEELLPRLPLLERLTVRHSGHQWIHICIHSYSLKSLFVGCQIRLTLRTPNLVHLSYYGHTMCIDWIDAPNLFYANMKFSDDLPHNDSRYFKLLRTLSNIIHVRKMTLQIDREEVFLLGAFFFFWKCILLVLVICFAAIYTLCFLGNAFYQILLIVSR